MPQLSGTLVPRKPSYSPCQRFEPEDISNIVNERLKCVTTENVSAIVPIYRPDVGTLNRCLECVIPQVDEVIVTRAADAHVPEGALKHPKVRYVMIDKHGIGYGRNVNFGARHSSGKFLLLLNDDVFLYADAVSKLKAEMKPGVGMVAHLLMYPEGEVVTRKGPIPGNAWVGSH